MNRLTAAVGIATVALAAAILATPANAGRPARDYIDDFAYECLAPDQAGADTVVYRGHITATLENLAGDYAERDLFFSDGQGGYTTSVFRAAYHISGHTIGGSAYTNGGGTADVASLNTYCVNVP